MRSSLRILLLLQRLSRLKQGECVYTLAKRYRTDPTTIRRDLLILRKAGYKLKSNRPDPRYRKLWRIAK